MNYDLLRKRLVSEQLLTRGISDNRVLDAFRQIPRHEFVPEEDRKDAYSDFPLAIGHNQTISQPYIVALMTERLNLSGNEKVLEIGTGSGYQTAILSVLAKEIYTIERIPGLAENAQRLLKNSGYKNIHYRVGDGTLGWKEEAPFDRIIVTAYSPEIPEPLIEQLNETGRIIIPLGEPFNQMLTLAQKINNNFEYQNICACVFVPLVGVYGVKAK